MTTPPTPKEVQNSLDTATHEGLPHFFVDLPEWISKDQPELRDNVASAPEFKQNTPLNCIVDLKGAIEDLQKKYPGKIPHVEAKRDLEDTPGQDGNDSLVDMPHPESDFRHIDPNVVKATRQEMEKKMNELRSFKGMAAEDGELKRAFREAFVPLDQALKMFPENAKGMQRLALTFEWMLCKVTTLFGQINAALDGLPADPKKAYTDARNAYLDLLRNLDDHEPKKTVKGELGYGRTLKWVYFLPMIHGGRIKGAQVVAKWNPHISSSGIPIPHK